MNPKQEDEYLTHIAAGTDPLTALAAMSGDPEDGSSRQSGGCSTGCLVVVLAVTVLLLGTLWR
jgi:hypothetical protein